MDYSVSNVLGVFDQSLVLVILAGAMVLGGAFTQYIEGIRLGFRDKVHAIPVVSNMYFFAHDIAFLLLFRRWFVEINHWLYQVFWFALVIFVVLECIIHYQTLKFGQADLMRGASRKTFVLSYLGLQALIAGAFFALYLVLDDPLFLIHFAVTEILSNVFNIPMLRRRGNKRGQSLVMASALLIGSNIGFFFFFLPLVSPIFRTLPFFAAGTIVTLLNLRYMWMLAKAPPHKHASHDEAMGAVPHNDVDSLDDPSSVQPLLIGAPRPATVVP